MNKVFLTGNIVNIRTSSNTSGNLNAFVTIALIMWKKKSNPNQKSTFITINFFDVSQNYIDNLKKARLISVEGHISTYNQKVGEDKIIKMLSIISDRCQVLLYKKSKSDEIREENDDFKTQDDFFGDKEDKSFSKSSNSSNNESFDDLEETIFLNDDGDLF